MSKAIKVTKGVDIKLCGETEKTLSEAGKSTIYAVKPPDFFGMIPKILAKEGADVKAGSPLFFDKKREQVKFTSPVSGEVVEIKRGLKRRIMEVRVLADNEQRYEKFTPWGRGDSREKLKETMLDMGLWPFIIQRPYGVVAHPEDTPKEIYISGFDSSPLAPDMSFVLKDEKENFQHGINAMQALTDGKVHLGVRRGDAFFDFVEGVEKHAVSGPHPAGNVGVLIHHVNPINKGEVVWTVRPADVALIGRSLKAGEFRAERIIATAGSEVKAPQYFKTKLGAGVSTLLPEGSMTEGDNRIISGNVLTGSKVEPDGIIGFYDTQLTVIPEGNTKKFFLTEGWLSLGFNKFSLNHSYPSWLMPNKKYRIDTNLNGEQRAFVMTGEMDRVFPFDIYPMRLVKSIIVNDIDQMEKLGIYEVIPEDFALCEFVCSSKINIQQVVEQGLQDLKEEMSA